LWWPRLTKDMQTLQFLCWNGMTDTEPSTTSGSNEEGYKTTQILNKQRHFNKHTVEI